MQGSGPSGAAASASTPVATAAAEAAALLLDPYSPAARQQADSFAWFPPAQRASQQAGAARAPQPPTPPLKPFQQLSLNGGQSPRRRSPPKLPAFGTATIHLGVRRPSTAPTRQSSSGQFSTAPLRAEQQLEWRAILGLPEVPRALTRMPAGFGGGATTRPPSTAPPARQPSAGQQQEWRAILGLPELARAAAGATTGFGAAAASAEAPSTESPAAADGQTQGGQAAAVSSSDGSPRYDPETGVMLWPHNPCVSVFCSPSLPSLSCSIAVHAVACCALPLMSYYNVELASSTTHFPGQLPAGRGRLTSTRPGARAVPSSRSCSTAAPSSAWRRRPADGMLTIEPVCFWTTLCSS